MVLVRAALERTSLNVASLDRKYGARLINYGMLESNFENIKLINIKMWLLIFLKSSKF